MNPPRIEYLAIDVHSKGGIQRYTRTQIEVLRECLGEENVSVLTVHSGERNRFEIPFPVAYSGGGSRLHKCRFALRAFKGALERPTVVWANHVNLQPVAGAIAHMLPSIGTVLNVYGRELWSGLSRVRKWALREAGWIVADCHATAGYVTRKLKVPPCRTSVVWDPVDTHRFRPLASGRAILARYGVPYSEETCYLMTVGRINENVRYKGYDRVLDAIKALGDRRVIYLIVGDGDDVERLRQRIQGEGLAERAFLLGNIPEQDLVAVYNASDVFALVSDRGPGRGEGVPLTALEAAACGVPLVVGNQDGSCEAVEDGIGGFVVPPNEPAALRRALATLIDNRVGRVQMGQAARERIVREFSYVRFRERTVGVLREMLGVGVRAT